MKTGGGQARMSLWPGLSLLLPKPEWSHKQLFRGRCPPSSPPTFARWMFFRDASLLSSATRPQPEAWRERVFTKKHLNYLFPKARPTCLPRSHLESELNKQAKKKQKKNLTFLSTIPHFCLDVFNTHTHTHTHTHTQIHVILMLNLFCETLISKCHADPAFSHPPFVQTDRP